MVERTCDAKLCTPWFSMAASVALCMLCSARQGCPNNVIVMLYRGLQASAAGGYVKLESAVPGFVYAFASSQRASEGLR